MGWNCVHIEHKRLAIPLDVTFRNMLIDEYRHLGAPANCRVYRRRHVGAHTYYFCPTTSEAMEAFLNFWEAFECPQPNVGELEAII